MMRRREEKKLAIIVSYLHALSVGNCVVVMLISIFFLLIQILNQEIR